MKELVETSRENRIEVKQIIGDTAYSGKENLLYTKEEEISFYSKLNPIISEGTRKPEVQCVFKERKVKPTASR